MYARPEKASHLDTIRYEIDMLHFCRDRIVEKKGSWPVPGDSYVYLESFLLHYRNLVEFFAGISHWEGDLVITEPRLWWTKGKVDEAEIKRLTRPDLREKYHREISKFLQHCTTQRAEVPQTWPIEDMYSKLNEVLSAFEALFPSDSSTPRYHQRAAEHSQALGEVSTAPIVTYKGNL